MSDTVGLMGYAVGVISEKKDNVAGYAMAILVACAMKIVGYYIAEALIYGNWVQPVVTGFGQRSAGRF